MMVYHIINNKYMDLELKLTDNHNHGPHTVITKIRCLV